MKDQARGFVIAAIFLAITLPVLYVGGEGAIYLATGKTYFPPGSGYRALYAPLDWAGDRWPAVYDGREALANGWLGLSGDPDRRAFIRPNFWNGFTLDVF